jgi:hypothetical protein
MSKTEKAGDTVSPSKENCRKALETLERLPMRDGSSEAEDAKFNGDFAFIKGFLTAAVKRLPSEEAIAKDQKRRRGRGGVPLSKSKTERGPIAARYSTNLGR